MPDSDSRRILSGPRGDVLLLHTRFRREQEPDLFDLIASLRKGTAANFVRSALEKALSSGALTPFGYALAADEILSSLQIQLRLAKQDILELQERNRLLEAQLRDLPASPAQQMKKPAAPPPSADAAATVIPLDTPALTNPTKEPTVADNTPETADSKETPAPKRNIPRAFAQALLSTQNF